MNINVNRIRLNIFFFIFASIFMPAFNIKKATAHFIPIKAYPTYMLVINCSKNKDIINIIINYGRTTPKVAAMLPRSFFCLKPI